jgi:serine protease DegQ
VPRHVAVFAALALALAGCSATDDREDETSAAAPGTTAPAATTEQTTTADDGEATATVAEFDFSDIPTIIAGVQPSVVTVLVEAVAGEGSGSGVIWDDEGRIVTNQHVVAGADEVEVALASGDRIDARVIGTDRRTDLAVLEVERNGLPAATFSDELPRVGELAIALGSPLGFTNTASAGIVSALHRDLPSGGTTPALIDLIQTDAAISPGNSGGALVNAAGTVIGINVAYIPPEARAVSIGFAIPAPVVRDIVPQLIEDGTAEHAYLGVTPAPVTDELSDAFELGAAEGALIQDVRRGSPAAEAGLRPGDVIVQFEGEPIRTVEDLFAAIREHDPGESVELTLVREGERTTADVTLAELPAELSR